MDAAHIRRGKLLTILAPFVSLLFVWLISQTALYNKLDAWIHDELQSLTAQELYFDDVIVLDIDDASLYKLQPDYGIWPYSRDIYGLVLDYLTQAGAERVVFDIIFAEPRAGDEVFSQAVGQNDNVVFVASSPVHSFDIKQGNVDYEKQLKALSWATSPRLPLSSLQHVLLPTAELVSSKPESYSVGIVDVDTDGDGVLRRMQAMHKVGQSSYLPSLPLAVSQLGTGNHLVDYVESGKTVSMGRHKWPVDTEGKFNIFFPKNANSVLSLSFYEVVEAAKGVSVPEGADQFFNGKTVFIGSTAFKSDKVNTPRGMMSGTYFLAIAYMNLKHDLVMSPIDPVWKNLLIFASFLPFAVMVLVGLREDNDPIWYGLSVVAVIVLVCVANWVLLTSYNQSGIFLFPVTLLVTGYIFHKLLYNLIITKYNLHLKEQHDRLMDINKQLENDANTDQLTGMFNRRAFLELFKHEISRFERDAEEIFTVVIMDLDHFKNVNDTYGHQVGDDVLQLFANVIATSIRKSDIAARWGGEEFVMLLPDTRPEQAAEVLNKVRINISKEVIVTDQGEFNVTVSMGAIEYNDASILPSECISLADEALYEAKETGRNRVCLYQKDNQPILLGAT